jgi:hypothetical protein
MTDVAEVRLTSGVSVDGSAPSPRTGVFHGPIVPTLVRLSSPSIAVPHPLKPIGLKARITNERKKTDRSFLRRGADTTFCGRVER